MFLIGLSLKKKALAIEPWFSVVPVSLALRKEKREKKKLILFYFIYFTKNIITMVIYHVGLLYDNTSDLLKCLYDLTVVKSVCL